MSTLRACVALLGLVVCVLLIIPTQAIMIPIGGKGAEVAPRLFFATLSRLFGVRIQLKGQQSQLLPTMYVSNHISWLDIFTFGAVLRGSFVARGDLAGWPVFGYLSTLQQTVFIDRDSPVRAGKQLNQLSERLHQNDSLILFPEGTTGRGINILPFKSSLFAVAERWTGETPLYVQPMSITYVAINNMPLTRYYLPYVGWYGDMDLMPHFWELLKMGRLTVVIEFHEPISSAEVTSRKQMSAQCRQVIAAAVERQNAQASDSQDADAKAV